MKRIVVLMMLFTLSLTACETGETVKVIVPNGAPALSQIAVEYEAFEEETPRYDVDTVYGPEPLISAFGSESHEIIIAPVNLGAKLYTEADAPYRFAATLTWGNLYLASGESLESLADLDGKTITAFGRNATPDIVLKAVLNTYQFETSPTLEYVDGVDTALSTLGENSDSVVLAAEPALSAYEMKAGNIQTLDLQDEWIKRVSEEAYPQAGVFVHMSLSNAVIDTYLKSLEKSTELVNEDHERLGTMIETLEYPFPPSLMDSVIPRSHIAYKGAIDSKESVTDYFEVIDTFNGALFGSQMPEDDFYYDRAS